MRSCFSYQMFHYSPCMLGLHSFAVKPVGYLVTAKTATALCDTQSIMEGIKNMSYPPAAAASSSKTFCQTSVPLVRVHPSVRLSLVTL